MSQLETDMKRHQAGHLFGDRRDEALWMHTVILKRDPSYNYTQDRVIQKMYDEVCKCSHLSITEFNATLI